jgi:hypothetical protein
MKEKSGREESGSSRREWIRLTVSSLDLPVGELEGGSSDDAASGSGGELLLGGGVNFLQLRTSRTMKKRES